MNAKATNSAYSSDSLPKEVVKKIRTRSLRIAILGAGYVGLPTAALFSDAGFSVVAIDAKLDVVSGINAGRTLLDEPGLATLISRNLRAGNLRATTDVDASLRDADCVMVAVQTPIMPNKKPDMSYLMEAVKDVGHTIKRGALASIISTVPPGTILKKVTPALEILSGLHVEKEFYIAYTPERMSPGSAVAEFKESPRLVGGTGPRSTKLAAALFRTVCRTVIETCVSTAEISKLAENTFRDVNIAYANQLALICERSRADVTDVIRLANTHPRISIHTPGPGVGGPCLTKDPYLLNLNSILRDHNLIKEARRINDLMPKHIVDLVCRSLKQLGKDPRGSRIAILGVAYKANVADSRGSPAQPIVSSLLEAGAEVRVFDPHCKNTLGALASMSLNECLVRADCAVVVTDHDEFRNLNLKRAKSVMAPNPILIDGRRIVSADQARSVGFLYRGIGLDPRMTAESSSAQ